MKITNFDNILILAPHTDDGELGLGGTISKLSESGKNITYVAFSTAQQSVPENFPKDILSKEVLNATKVLGIPSSNVITLNYEVRKFNYNRQEILEDIIKLRNNNNFDLVFIPNSQDIHQDHAVISQEGLRAFKNTTVLGYESPWNNIHTENNCFSVLERKHIDTKIKALQEYKSQGRKNYLDPEFIYSLARVRGVQSGRDLAEAFQIFRIFL